MNLEYNLVDDGTLDTVINVSCPVCGRIQKCRIHYSDMYEFRDPETGGLTNISGLIDTLSVKDTWECACTTED